MHGGSNSSSLFNKKIDFAKNSLDYLLHSNKIKKDDKNTTKPKFIKIEKIEKLKF